MYKYEFLNRREIRMGSPFNICDLQLQGDYTPDLRTFEFQDIAITSDDSHTIYLVTWVVGSNEPRFKVIKLDEVQKSLALSAEVKGVCCQLFLKNEGRDLVSKVFRSENDDEIEIKISF